MEIYLDTYKPLTSRAEKNFYINLKGESMTLSKEYIDNMRTQSGIILESVLDSVILPYWETEAKEPSNSAAKLPKQAREGQYDQESGEGKARSMITDPDPYTAIFDWLWNDKVRKIFTVEVDDDGPEPHTNAAIREAFRGKEQDDRDFEVEVWKWKKFDICCDTVATAVPNAREVYLYSHGNMAVLRGWVCDSSLTRMKNTSGNYGG